MRILKASQIREWVDSPITEQVREVLEKELQKAYEARADVFFSGEPDRTHEVRATWIGTERVLQDLIELLSMNNDNGVLDTYLEDNEVHLVDDIKEEENSE